MPSRIIIIGNAGSGKSYLAGKLGVILGLPVVDLDTVYWMPGSYTVKRSSEDVKEKLHEVGKEKSWIVEGVYGELAEFLTNHAELLLWLDIDWKLCRTSLIARRKNLTNDERQRTEDSFRVLLKYAEGYEIRSDGRSHRGHGEIFERFGGNKRRLISRKATDDFLIDVLEGSIKSSETSSPSPQ